MQKIIDYKIPIIVILVWVFTFGGFVWRQNAQIEKINTLETKIEALQLCMSSKVSQNEKDIAIIKNSFGYISTSLDEIKSDLKEHMNKK